VRDVLNLPAVVVTDTFADMIVTGRNLDAGDVLDIDGEFAELGEILLKSRAGRVLAIGQARSGSHSFRNLGAADLIKYGRVLH